MWYFIETIQKLHTQLQRRLFLSHQKIKNKTVPVTTTTSTIAIITHSNNNYNGIQSSGHCYWPYSQYVYKYESVTIHIEHELDIEGDTFLFG